jgi:hypothetical protein
MLWLWLPLLAPSALSLFLLAPSASSLCRSLRRVLIPFLLPPHRPSSSPRAPPVRACEYLFSGSHPLACPYPHMHTQVWPFVVAYRISRSGPPAVARANAVAACPLLHQTPACNTLLESNKRWEREKKEDALGSPTPWRSTKVGEG